MVLNLKYIFNCSRLQDRMCVQCRIGTADPRRCDGENSQYRYTSADGITLVCQYVFEMYCCRIIIHSKPTRYYDWPTDRSTGRRSDGSRNSRGESVARIRANHPSGHGCSRVWTSRPVTYIYIIYEYLSVYCRKLISRLPIDISTLVQFSDIFPILKSVTAAALTAVRFQQRKPSVETVLSSQYYNRLYIYIYIYILYLYRRAQIINIIIRFILCWEYIFRVKNNNILPPFYTNME